MIDLSNDAVEMEEYNAPVVASEGKSSLKPIMKKLTEIKPPQLDYLGVSYGLSKVLFKFWKKSKFTPLYLRQTKNEITSEHTCIMLKGLNKDLNDNSGEEESWEALFAQDFNKRFLSLLAY